MNKKSSFKLKNQNSNSVWFLILGVASTTLFLKTDFYDPFNTAKLILLLVVSGWIFGHLLYSYKAEPITLKSKQFITLIIVISFILFLAISTAFSDVLVVSLIGDTQRRNGFLCYLALSVIFLYASKSINKFNVLRVYKVGILTGFIVSFYGLMQLNGKDFIAWNNPYNAMISTLGNPNFASAILATLFSLAFFGLLQNNLNLVFKLISLIFILIALVAIIGSDSRQGLLAIFFSLIFYFSVYVYLRNKTNGIFLILFSGIISILAMLGMLQKGPLTSILYKDSVSVRGYYWRAGIEMFKEFPFTGVGVDRYGAYFKEFREAGYALRYGYDITSSNAHNTFIHFFATSGVFVGIAYLSLVFFVFITGINSLKRGDLEDKKVLLGLLSAWIGFQSQSLISIDNIGISVWGWLLSGAILGLCNNNEVVVEKSLNVQTASGRSVVQINVFQPLVSSVILLPIVIGSTYLYRAETNLNYLKNYSTALATQNRPILFERSNQILGSRFIDPYYKFRTALLLLDTGEANKAYEVIKELHSFDKKNSDYMRSLAYLEGMRNNSAAAISIRKELSKTDPWNADNYFQLMLLYKNSSDIDNTNSIGRQIISIAPESDYAKKAKEILSLNE